MGSLKNNLKICAFVICAALAFAWHVDATHKAVEGARSVLIQKYEKALRDKEKEAQKASKAMQASANKMRDEKDAKINLISGQLNVVLSSLRNRPTRPADVANNPPSSRACTATSLYAEDAEFLAREAARADTILAERDYYYQQYEEVRKKYGNSE